MQENNNLIKQKEKYEIISFWACVVAVVVSILGMILRIIFEFVKLNIYVFRTLSIIDLIIYIIAIIAISISFIKLKKIKRIIAENENNENK